MSTNKWGTERYHGSDVLIYEGEIAALTIDEVAEMLNQLEAASIRSKELQERVERLASCLSRVLYWDNGDLPENAIRDIKSVLSGEATKEKPSGKWTVSKMFNDSVLLFDGVAQLSLTWDELADKLNASESLEAYNRECKRVDELTEEVDKKNLRIQELEKELAQWRKGPHLTPDGAQSYIRCANERADKIAELEGLLNEILRFKPSLLTCIQKDFQYPDNAIKALEDAEKSLEETKKLFVKEN